MYAFSSVCLVSHVSSILHVSFHNTDQIIKAPALTERLRSPELHLNLISVTLLIKHSVSG